MEKRKKILIVDDTEINRALLTDMLSPIYDTMEVSSGLGAVTALRDQYAEIALVLLDIVMPEMDGFEVLSVMERNGWLKSIPVIMISAEVSSSYVDHAYDLGATDYITRPFDEKTVRRRVQNTIMLYTKQQFLENMVAEQIMEKERSNSQMVEILSNIVEFRNGESGTHVLHIRVISNILLQSLQNSCPQYGLTAARIALITNASALHDIGKISIDEKVLNKPGKLTAEEYEAMKQHTVIGAQMLERSPGYADSELIHAARDVCRWHHERYDGRGYPDGLKGDEIPIAAQVVALADVYDALTSPRVYKPAFSHEKAVNMILNGECGTFSPLLLKCLIDNQEKLAQELDVRSPGGAGSSMELERAVSEIMSNGELQLSSRTLTLLEQERIKYRFYASMTKEILFEYDCGTDILEFSEWGAQYLSVPELIPHPANNSILQERDKEAYMDIACRLKKAQPANPVVSHTYCLTMNGKARWFKAVARPLWDREDETSYSRVIGKLLDIHEDQVKLDELRRLAERDPLTGLLNRGAFFRITEGVSKSDKPVALLMIDVDRFKEVNDGYGHSTGDLALKRLADLLAVEFRTSDVPARLGGDEFVVLMLDVTPDQREVIRQKVNQMNSTLREPMDGLPPISVSVGVAFSPLGYSQKLYGRADQALYRVKQAGRCGCRFSDEV